MNSVDADKALFGTTPAGGSPQFVSARAILKKNCAECHANNIASYSSEADFISHNYVVPRNPQGSLLFQSLQGSNTGGSQDMPKGRAALSNEDIQTLRAWIESMTEGQEPEPTTPFGKAQKILDTKCATCHEHEEFSKYDELDFVKNGLVVKGKPNLSELYNKLKGTTVPGVDPPDMPKDQPALSPDELDTIKAWIKQMKK